MESNKEFENSKKAIEKQKLVELKSVANAVVEQLRKMPEDEVHKTFAMIDYHGFEKARFPEAFLEELAKLKNLNAREIQLEVVHVARDLTHEIHYHRSSSAVTTILGPEEKFSAPKLGKAFLTDHWFDVNVGDVVEIPAGTPHGFTVEEGGSLYFLSIQSPPIVKETGEDDYTAIS